MALTTAAYLSLLQGLLPPGSAWSREASATLTLTLEALADELARIDLRADNLLDELYPQESIELLTDWERLCGLSAGDLPGDRRRAAVIIQLMATGGSSLSYFQKLADVAMGVGAVVITEGPEAYVWRVTFQTNLHTYFTAGDSSAGELLSDWSDLPATIGLFERIKPAHTRLIFASV